MAASVGFAEDDYDELIIRHPNAQKKRMNRGKSFRPDLETEINGWRNEHEDDAKLTPVPPAGVKQLVGEPGASPKRRTRGASIADQLEAKIDHYQQEMTEQDEKRGKAKRTLGSQREIATVGMEPHSARRPAASRAGGEAGMMRTGSWASKKDLSVEVPLQRSSGSGIGRTSSGNRVTLAVTPLSADGKNLEAESEEAHPLPQELLGYRDPAAALFRIGLTAMQRLESKGTVRKVMRNVQRLEGSGGGRRERLPSGAEKSPKQSEQALQGLVKLMFAAVGQEDSFDDFETLMEEEGLSDALRSSTGQLSASLSSKFLRIIKELVVGRGVSTKDLLHSLLALHDKRPTVTTSLSCWLYGKLLQADPEQFSLTREQIEVWRCLKCAPSRRRQDRRLGGCEAWAVEHVDLLRHLPKATLREILLTASTVKLSPGQKVLRVGETCQTISIVFAGALSAMVSGLDAHEHTKLVATKVIHAMTSPSRHELDLLKKQASMTSDRDSASTWLRRWQEALAKSYAQKWAVKTKVKIAGQKLKEQVPLMLGPNTAVGQSTAVSCATLNTALRSPDHSVASNARNIEVKRVETLVRAVSSTLVLQVEEASHVLAIEKAMQIDRRWKFEKLFAFEGLRACSCDALEILAHRVNREVVRKGETLFNADEPATEVFFVLSGAMQITVPRSDGTVNRIATVGSGATFGSFPQVLEYRAATVTATADCEVLSVHVYNLHNAMARQHEVFITDYGTADRFSILRSAVKNKFEAPTSAVMVPGPLAKQQQQQQKRPNTVGGGGGSQSARGGGDARASTSGGARGAQTARLPSTSPSLHSVVVDVNRQSRHQPHVPAGNRGARGVAKAMGSSARSGAGGTTTFPRLQTPL